MRKTDQRRKRRARELRPWEGELRRGLGHTRKRLGMTPDEAIPDDLLVAEALDLARPGAVKGRDAVLPAPHLDLAEEWFRARLQGEADTEELRVALARRIARPADEHFSGIRGFGVTRERVERAVSYFAELKKRSE